LGILDTVQFRILSTSLLSKNLKIKISKCTVLSFGLYGCETWSLTLKEEHRLRVFENRMLRRISGPRREEVAGGWRRLHNEEFHNLYASPNTIRVINSRGMRWVGKVPRMGEMGIVYEILVGNPGGMNHSEDLGVDGNIMLEWMLGK
jgi:hypothetical protein